MKKGLILFLAGLICSCMPHTSEPFALKAWNDEGKTIYLEASELNVISEATPYDRLPHIEQQMPITPEAALEKWALSKIYAVNASSPRKVVFIIRKADMIQEKKKSDSWYTFNNVAYTLSFEIELVFKEAQRIIYSQRVGGMEMRAVPQKSALSTKEDAWKEMMNAMLEKIGQKLMSELPEQFIYQ